MRRSSRGVRMELGIGGRTADMGPGCLHRARQRRGADDRRPGRGFVAWVRALATAETLKGRVPNRVPNTAILAPPDQPRHAQTTTKALQTCRVRTGRPWQPQGWKVRFLRPLGRADVPGVGVRDAFEAVVDGDRKAVLSLDANRSRHGNGLRTGSWLWDSAAGPFIPVGPPVAMHDGRGSRGSPC
jgi:hypothetical protein